MNESVNGSIYALLNDMPTTLGINSSAWFAMLAAGMIIISFIFIYTRSRNMTVSILAANVIGIVFAVMGILPLYSIAMLVIGSLFIVWRYASSGDDYITYPESYRDRMIKAYEAKFGGSNTAFNERLDSHIKAVESLRKGYTRSVHMDALKRLENFVEIK